MGPEPEAVEASLMQAYSPRDPLAEYIDGLISFRTLRVMVEGLDRSPVTPIGRAIHGPWADREHLLRLSVLETRKLYAAFYNRYRSPGYPTVEVDDIPVPPLTKYQSDSRPSTSVAESDLELAMLADLRRAQEGDSSGE